MLFYGSLHSFFLFSADICCRHTLTYTCLISTTDDLEHSLFEMSKAYHYYRQRPETNMQIA